MLTWKRILVATDFSSPAERALRSAKALAQRVGGKLALIHVVQLPPASYLGGLGRPRDLERSWVEAARAELHGVARKASARGTAIKEILRVGKPWVEILDVARDEGVDAICLGNSGHSAIERLLLGSTAENVVRRSPVPVLVVRDRALAKINRVLVPWHFDEGSKSAIRFALERFPEKTKLAAFHAVAPLPPADPVVGPLIPDMAAIREEMRSLLDEMGAERVSEEVVLMADAAAAIVESATKEDVDLILLATHGRKGMARALLGSVAEKVVRHADRPVLVLPGPGARGAAKGSKPGERRGRPRQTKA